MKKRFLILILGLILVNCKKEENQGDTLFQFLKAEETGIVFQNTIKENDSINIMNYEYLYNGGGVGIGDFNNDQLPDLIFTANQLPAKLYLNKGNIQFEDITENSLVDTNDKWITGVSIVDINQDGYDDIYLNVGGMGNVSEFPNLLFVNNGDATFREVASDYGLADKGESIQSIFFDYDRDGDLDMYLLTGGGFEKSAIQARPILDKGQNRNTDRLYRNDFDEKKGHPVFTNVSSEAGINIEGFGLGVAIIDANNDQWADVYVSNDYLSKDLLYINNQDGSFSEESLKYFGHLSHFSMGNDVADIDNDGFLDLITVDMLPEDLKRRKLMSGASSYDVFQLSLAYGYGHQHMRNMIHRNNGDGSFSEIGQLAGVDKTDWSWAPLFADFNNDGKNDLYVTNGFGKDITDLDFVKFREKTTSAFTSMEALEKSILDSLNERPVIKVSNFAYKNTGDYKFEKVTKKWGLDKKSISNGAVYADLDLDGDLELVVNNIDQPAFVYKNLNREKDSVNSNYINIRLMGKSGNLDGIGAFVKVTTVDGIQTKQQQPVRGFQSTVSKILHFGLGVNTKIDQIEVKWTDGKVTTLRELPVNDLITVSYVDARAESSPEAVSKILFTKDTLFNYEHKERFYNDYATQPLLPHNFANQGPGMAVGDINLDGLQDVFIGGAYGSLSTFYLQQKGGDFIKMEIPDTEVYEDLDALLFDVNADGWLDLYVTSGGSERYEGHIGYRDRLYINQEGRFTEGELPEMFSSSSTVVGADYDRDGDTDLFIGGRVEVGKYPVAPRSYILENRNGVFLDVTSAVNPEIMNIGMVTAAIWTDFDNDNKLDLVVAGEFMPITFFKQEEKNSFKNVTEEVGAGKTSGLWLSLATADLDNDGDLDFVAGNLGLNSPFKAFPDKPLYLHYADFDDNGAVDPILSKYEEGDYYPMASLDQLTQQLPSIKKKILYYRTFSKTSTSELLSLLNKDEYKTLKAEELRSSFLENMGDGTFRISPLPVQAQFSPVNSILIEDINTDGLLDILLVGNDYHSEVVHGRYDASFGTILINQKNMDFEILPNFESGFKVVGDARSLVQLDLKDGVSAFLAGINDGSLQSFRWEPQREKIYPKTNEVKALISFWDGTQRKMEFTLGNGSLSQSSLSVLITRKTKVVTFYNSIGTITRKLEFSKNQNKSDISRP